MMILRAPSPRLKTKYHLWEHRDDFSSLLDTLVSFSACINIFFSSSSQRSGIYVIQNKRGNDGPLSLAIRGQKTQHQHILQTSFPELPQESTFWVKLTQQLKLPPVDQRESDQVKLLNTFLHPQMEVRDWGESFCFYVRLFHKANFCAIYITDHFSIGVWYQVTSTQLYPRCFIKAPDIWDTLHHINPGLSCLACTFQYETYSKTLLLSSRCLNTEVIFVTSAVRMVV